MKKLVRIAAIFSVCVAVFGMTSFLAARSRPAPPPPVQCGCICSDGSLVTTHAPDANSCPSACATACQGSETF